MGELFVVATPIGNLADLSNRARTVLGQSPLILAEDTRRTRKLLTSIGISSRLLSLNEHNIAGRIQTALDALARHDVALVSDAGTPTISDPGHQLIAAAHDAGIPVRAVPGPSAVIAAISVSGLPGSPFRFLGYAPRTAGQITTWAKEWAASGETIVFFEAPSRIAATMGVIATVDPSATIVVCRELTKVFEQVVRAPAPEILARFADGLLPERGEFVVVARSTPKSPAVDIDGLILELLRSGDGPNQAARLVATQTGLPKSEVYKRALELRSDQAV
jgi:16S rRNA (cytidine1402-2'-O)-methyltransferase